MKKKILMLLPILGVISLSSCGVRVNTIATTKVEVDTGTTTLKEEYQKEASFELSLPEKETIPEEEMDGRYVDENWREYSISIGYKQAIDFNKYYTAEPGDYITKIFFDTTWLLRKVVISFDVNFYLWDDMEVEFTFDNGYSTGVKHYKSSIAKKEISLPKNDVNRLDLKNHYITKVRVRTVD